MGRLACRVSHARYGIIEQRISLMDVQHSLVGRFYDRRRNCAVKNGRLLLELK